MKELLDSDRVNYLVWRYLLESNYRESAAKLQKEWRIQAPHRHFEFAPHVQNYALVNLLNKGLVYNSLERDYAQSLITNDAASPTTAVKPRGVFGPLVAQAPIDYGKLADDEDEPVPSSETPQKHPHEPHHPETQTTQLPLQQVQKQSLSHEQAQSQPQPQPESRTQQQTQQPPPPPASLKRQVEPQLANGTAAKRPKLSSAHDPQNGPETAASPMEVDHHQSDGHAYPSPLEGEQTSTPAPRTEGPDHATQTDKVDELEAKTVYLRLTPYDEPTPSASSAAAIPTAELSHNRPHHNPILLHCEWNPKDSSRLAAAGTDALARIWTASPTMGQEQVADHVDPGWPSVNLINEEFLPNTRITAFTWTSDGKHIIVATDDDHKACIDLWDIEGKQVHHWDGFEAPIVKLRSNPFGTQILSISPSPGTNGSTQPDGWLMTLLPSTSASPIEKQLPGYDDGDEPDAAWINETDFVISIRTTLSVFKHTDNEILFLRELKTRPNDPLTAIQYDGTKGSGRIAAATSDGFIDIWDASGEMRSSDAPAHDGRISVLQWQPLQAPGPESERLLASGGEDGTIAIRDARLSDNKAKFEMTIDANPVLALSFTPDGAFIAGATRDRVLIWKVGEYSMPRAQWSRTSRPGRSSPKVNGTAEIEDQHCLCWDATGQRLAFGVNDLLAVINFR